MGCLLGSILMECWVNGVNGETGFDYDQFTDADLDWLKSYSLRIKQM